MMHAWFIKLTVVAALIASLCSCTLAISPQPRVLVDQYHYNQLSMYPEDAWRMTTLAGELIQNGYAVTSSEVPVTSSALANCDVFIITAPTLNYSSSELTALRNFVTNGGGVWIAADYGTLNGHPTAWSGPCQQLASVFGFTLGNNQASDPSHCLYDYPYWITLGESTISSHPVTNGVTTLQCFSTTTLAGPAGSSVLASTYSTSTPAGSAVAVTSSYGTGRVMVTGNSLYLADVVPNRNINGTLVSMPGITAADNRRFVYQALTHTAGAKARPLISIASPASSALVYGVTNIVGTACDAGITSYRVEFANQADPSVYELIKEANTSKINDILASWDTSTVAEGNYNIRVSANNGLGAGYSCSVNVQVKHVSAATTIQQCKSLQDGSLVQLSNKTASTGSDDFQGLFYIEEPNHASAIQVVSDAAVNRDDSVSVTGVMDTRNGERFIRAIEVTSKHD